MIMHSLNKNLIVYVIELLQVSPSVLKGLGASGPSARS